MLEDTNGVSKQLIKFIRRALVFKWTMLEDTNGVSKAVNWFSSRKD